MLTMDVFKQDAFSATSMTAAVDRIGYVPSFLASVPGLFVPKPIRTASVFIEERDNDAAIIQTSPRGAPPAQRGRNRAKVRNFQTVRIGKAAHITADELQGVRAFGSETELQALQAEIAQRQIDVRRDIELTRENLFLGAVQGLVKDADGSTIYDWATEFGQTIPTEVDFDLDNASPASGALRKRCTAAVRSITKGLKGLTGGNQPRIMALCGDAFWDDLTAHPEVRASYLNWQAAAELRMGNAYGNFTFGDIEWVNYRGTDDGTTVGINTDLAKFFPIGAGIFPVAYAPAETFDFVNTMGREIYSWVVTDKDRNAWADIEMYSYPLPVCTMPQALYRARRT